MLQLTHELFQYCNGLELGFYLNSNRKLIIGVYHRPESQFRPETLEVEVTKTSERGIHDPGIQRWLNTETISLYPEGEVSHKREKRRFGVRISSLIHPKTTIVSNHGMTDKELIGKIEKPEYSENLQRTLNGALDILKKSKYIGKSIEEILEALKSDS